MIKTYSECIALPTYIERFRYLSLKGVVGEETFGFDRYLNQRLYQHSSEWKSAREKAIIRDFGCDLAIEDRQIFDKIYVHHINPVTMEDVIANNPILFNLENLICTSFRMHNAIHYGDENLLLKEPITRRINDTAPWR